MLLSAVEEIKLKADNIPVESEKIHLSVEDETYTLKEKETVTCAKWELGQKAALFVDLPQDLSQGEHKRFLRRTNREEYYAFPLKSRRTRMMRSK